MDENLEDMNLESAFDQEPDDEDFDPPLTYNYRLMLQNSEKQQIVFILVEGKDEDDAWDAINQCLKDRVVFKERVPIDLDWSFYNGHYGLEEELKEYYGEFRDELKGKWSFERYEIVRDLFLDLWHLHYEIGWVKFPEDGDAEHITIEKVEDN